MRVIDRHAIGTLAEWIKDGPRLVRAGVDRVTITDRQPLALPGPVGTWWAWWHRYPYVAPCVEPYDVPARAEVPRTVWHFLGNDLRSMRTFRSEEEAMTALAKALIAWAREAPVTA